MSDPRTVVLVGHCGPDMFLLKNAIQRSVPGAAIEVVNDADALAARATSDHVLLVNRVLDGRFDTDSGIELIRSLSSGDEPPIAILVSNFDEAQREARTAGARPGFGKKDLYRDETAELLRDATSA